VVVHSVINKTTVATFTYQSNQATVRQARRDRICLYPIYTNYSLVQHNRIGIRYLGIFRKILPFIHKVYEDSIDFLLDIRCLISNITFFNNKSLGGD